MVIMTAIVVLLSHGGIPLYVLASETIYILPPSPRPFVLALAGLMEGSILERMSLLDWPPKGRTLRCISQEMEDISTLLSLRHFPLSRRDSSFLSRFAESPRHLRRLLRVVFFSFSLRRQALISYAQQLQNPYLVGVMIICRLIPTLLCR